MAVARPGRRVSVRGTPIRFRISLLPLTGVIYQSNQDWALGFVGKFWNGFSPKMEMSLFIATAPLGRDSVGRPFGPILKLQCKILRLISRWTLRGVREALKCIW